MTQAPTSRYALLATVALIAGCASSGPVGPARPVHTPSEAGHLTLLRDGSLVGLWAPMRVRLDQDDLFRLGRNQQVSLQLDPGDYLLEYSIGFNNCSRVIHLKPRQVFRLRLLPNCMMYEE
ncbi:hypothetical protein [Thiocystis violascens]|uniref:Uncharacterized protein n=1 Tax=Thiocystis violascens (strain ATCC 17096 / DSM 198 / 6111) TaxID=765911 RepID=I3Y6X4_THIV6|nr:hypothetical protein [Thiocystis violascens]AFL72742.1 hypothetical protein Thivi_0688 [Thiocystis violascens DSM 198]